MSASKKKLQRKSEVQAEQISEAEAKQIAYKKKARSYSIIAIVVVILVAALLIWNSGVFQKNATAATVGNEKLSVAEMGYYYYNNYYYQMYSYYGISADTVLDSTKGTTYRDYFMELALTDAQDIQALYNEALANGYSDADVAEELKAQIETYEATALSTGYSYKAYLKAVMGKYMTPALFEKLATRSLLANKYYTAVSAEKTASFSAAELEAYYNEHVDEVDQYTYSYLYFLADTVSADDEEAAGLTEAEITALNEQAMADAKAKAEAALAEYNNGASVAELIESAAPSTSVDHNKVTGKSAISSAYSEELLKLGNDEATVVEYEENGYYMIVFHGKARNDELTASVYNIFVQASTTTDSNGYYTEPDVKGWETAKQKADEILADYTNGKQSAETFSALATKYGMADGGLSTGVHSGSSSASTDERIDWLFNEGERVKGDTTIAQYESSLYGYGYYVSYFLEWGEPVWMLTVRSTLANEYLSGWMESLAEANPAELLSGAKNVG